MTSSHSLCDSPLANRERQHVLTAWTSEERDLRANGQETLIYVLVRRCTLCGERQEL